MRTRTIGLSIAAAGLFAIAPLARADYYSHPELRPENRCVDENGERFDPLSDGSRRHPTIEPIHCQKLFWDLPVTTELGTVRVGSQYAEDSIPRFPRGVTDRLPPMYVGTLSSGEPEGFERLEDCEANASNCERLCENPDEVGWWEPLLNEDGSPQTGTDDLGFHAVDDPGTPEDESLEAQSGPLFQASCHRGSRARFGPWQVGTDEGTFDGTTSNSMVRFENTERLNRDVAEGRTCETPGDDCPGRIEWSVKSEFYNHFSSHHGTCYWAQSSTCNNSENPLPREAFQPGGACWNYQKAGNGPDDPEGQGGCYAGDADTSCSGGPGGSALSTGNGFRNATQIPGRLSVQMAKDERGIAEVEDAIWMCNHHVVSQLPPGSYGMNELANYRLQKGGLVNPREEGNIAGVPPGEVIGGAVGEMIMQSLTTHATSGTRPLNIVFNVAADLATTMYPPFTWNYHTSLWTPPFDSAVTLTAIHSHHRMVKGYMDVTPANPVRLESPDPACGGSRDELAPHIYENWEWEDAQVCQYWKDPDGPVVLRKSQAIATTCYVNNGVTPEAIKHGLVAGSTVEALKVLGATQIPDYPETMQASTWGDPLAASPIGQELLYGTHPPINYRVVYKCAAVTPFTSTPVSEVCNPNPAVDADGDYIDGPYVNDVQCGGQGICEPSTIMFRCVGEDEMCIGVTAYYALDRLGDTDGGHDQAMENLQEGNVNEVGTPGNLGVKTDLSGSCHECEPGL